MNSPFATLIIAIMERLKSEVPELRWIDQDLGQLEMEGRPSVGFPCLLIDFGGWKYETIGENIQDASGFVILRLAVDAWSNTNSLTHAKWREQGLSFYDLEWKIYKALQGWKPPHSEEREYGYMLRTNTDREEREDNLRVRSMSFSCSYEDYEASPSYTVAKIKVPEFIPPDDMQQGGDTILFPNTAL